MIVCEMMAFLFRSQCVNMASMHLKMPYKCTLISNCGNASLCKHHGYVLFTFLSMLALIFLCESVPRKASHVMNTFCHVLTYEHPFRFLSFWAGPIDYLNRFLL